MATKLDLAVVSVKTDKRARIIRLLCAKPDSRSLVFRIDVNRLPVVVVASLEAIIADRKTCNSA